MTDLPPCQAASELRRLTDAALSAVAPDGAVLRHLHLDGGKLTLIDESGAPAWSGRLDAYRRIRVLGAGKGAICRKGNGPDTSGSRKADTRSPMRRARRLRAKSWTWPGTAARTISSCARLQAGPARLPPPCIRKSRWPTCSGLPVCCWNAERQSMRSIRCANTFPASAEAASCARPSRPPCSGSSYPMWWATTLTSSPPAPPCPIRAPSPIACG